MYNITEYNCEDRFANGQSRRDLRVGSDARELETQLMEAIDGVGDFVRFVDRSYEAEISSRSFTHDIVIKPNQRRLFQKWKPASRIRRIHRIERIQRSESSTRCLITWTRRRPNRSTIPMSRRLEL